MIRKIVEEKQVIRCCVACTASALPISSEQHYGMFFIISFDNHGYFMMDGWGFLPAPTSHQAQLQSNPNKNTSFVIF